MKILKSLSLHWAGVVAVLLVTSGHCRGQLRSTPGKPAQEEITLQDCRVTLLQSAVLASTRSGIIDKIDVLDGDLVPKGLVIAQIRDDLASADVATVTFATPRVPDDQLRGACEAAGRKVHLIGDCYAPRSVLAATRQGYEVGMAV